MDVITTHLHADFDGLASMIAARKLYPGAQLILPGGAQEIPRAFLKRHDLGIAPLSALERFDVTRLVMVDAQDPDRIGRLKDLYLSPQISVHIYDHHPTVPHHEGRPIELQVIESIGATTTLLIERLAAQGIGLSPFEATVLALGLYEETGSLTYPSTTPRDAEAAARLLRAGADLRLVRDTLTQPLAPEAIALLHQLLEGSETVYLEDKKVLLASAVAERYKGDLAELVQKLAELEGYDAVLAALTLGDSGDKVQVIGRSRHAAIDVAQVIRTLGGGGHPEAAAATVKGRTVLEVREQLRELLMSRQGARLARDVMTTPVMTIEQRVTLAEAERQMTRQEVNAFPVVDANGCYVGVITREVVQKGLFHGLTRARVGELAQGDAYTAGVQTPFREIAARMVEHNQRFVPIVDGEQVVGVITRTDLLRTMHEELHTTGVPAKGEMPALPARRRNVRPLLEAQLPPRTYQLLEEAGRLAERLHVSVYAVGGLVRDLLLQRPEHLTADLDLVVEGDGIAFAEAWANERGADVSSHARFGTAVLTFQDRVKVDVATARSEYYEYPTALPTVERSSIKKDLYRRDFTINTLAIRLNAGRLGELLDYYGGQRDLHERVIRVLHSLSFIEDPTRVFRAVRFEQRFGFRLGQETLRLIKGAVKMQLFHRLSSERLRQELVLLLSEADPPKVLARLAELELLKFIHPRLPGPRAYGNAQALRRQLAAVTETWNWYRLDSMNWPQTPGGPRGSSAPEGRGPERWLLYLLAVLETLPKRAVHETLRRLHFPERHAEVIRVGCFQAERLVRQLGRNRSRQPADTNRLLAGLPEEVLLFLLARAANETVKREITAYLSTYRYVRPVLTGHDLASLGLPPGPSYRQLLDRLREARLNGEVRTETEERELVQRLVKTWVKR